MSGIVLCGFMGTGKSTVARVLGGRLGIEVIDLDEMLEARLGASIAEVFQTRGEAVFREAEAALCAELAATPRRAIVATGGGTVLDPSNRRHLARLGPLVCLRAEVDTLVQRLMPELAARPLLDDETSPAVGLAALLDARHPIYASLPVQVGTDERTPEEVADAVLAAVGHYLPSQRVGLTAVETLPVELAGHDDGYEVLVGVGLLARLGDAMHGAGLPRGRVALVTNPTVGAHWLAPAMSALQDAGYEPVVCEVPDGERHKTLETVSWLYAGFVEAGLDRSSAVVALGGGVIGDMAGFAAATYLRGLPIVQVPTSLLAMVDASVGGKTGVDLAAGKNLVGAFAQPRLVVVDPQVLSTLAEVEFRSGMAEVVKHAIIAGRAMFEALEAEPSLPSTGISSARLARAIGVKVGIVEADPLETGRRAVLNLGHTFAHALERLSGYAMRHGEAVAIGLVAATRLGVGLGRCDASLPGRVRDLLTRLGLPTTADDVEPRAWLDAMSTDKKRRGGKLRFVVPEALGRVVLVDDVPESAVLEAMQPEPV